MTASADLSIVKTGPATVVAARQRQLLPGRGQRRSLGRRAVSVTDTLPTGVTYVSAAGTGWTCTNSGNVSVTCTRPALVTGATAPTITVVVTAPA